MGVLVSCEGMSWRGDREHVCLAQGCRPAGLHTCLWRPRGSWAPGGGGCKAH